MAKSNEDEKFLLENRVFSIWLLVDEFFNILKGREIGSFTIQNECEIFPFFFSVHDRLFFFSSSARSC
jgi:hypothetical protein